MKEIKIDTEVIKLDSFLKWAGITSQGSDAKIIIKNGEIKINGEVEIRRGKKLFKGDIIQYDKDEYKIV